MCMFLVVMMGITGWKYGIQAKKGEPNNTPDEILSMVKSLASPPHRIILFLQQSSVEWCSSLWLDAIRDIDPTFKRTIIVVSKFDNRLKVQFCVLLFTKRIICTLLYSLVEHNRDREGLFPLEIPLVRCYEMITLYSITMLLVCNSATNWLATTCTFSLIR